MTRKTKFFCSLSFKVTMILLFSLATAVLVYWGVHSTGDYIVKEYYMSPEAVSSRRMKVYNEFRLYVNNNAVTSYDSDKIGAWTKAHPYVTLVVHGENIRIESGRAGAIASDVNASNSGKSPSSPAGEGMFYLRFSDGIFSLSISESSQSRQYFLSTVAAIVFACLYILLIMLTYIHRITSRVTSLAKNAREIGRGDLKREIHVRGNDELSRLGTDMDDMRRAIIQRIDSEHTAWQANNSLITAISHDIRTPMTSLIGYLELLKSGKYANEEQKNTFISGAYTKAMQMKDLTDELFKYFLVFGNNSPPLTLEVYDAGILLDQLLGEGIIEFSQSGYDMRSIKFTGQCYIKADVLSLKRLFDNLFSNIRKYADKSRPVVIMSELDEGRFLSVCFSNSKDASAGKVESSRIGLQTCAKIAEQLGGRFKTRDDGDHFVAELILPVTMSENDAL